MSDSDEAWHLPKFMRDFHDQKVLFRAIAADDVRQRSGRERARYPMPNLVDAHVYTVDVFLRFMAEHGYTLQRCRRDLEFKDIEKTISEDRAVQKAASAAVLKSFMSGQ